MGTRLLAMTIRTPSDEAGRGELFVQSPSHEVSKYGGVDPSTCATCHRFTKPTVDVNAARRLDLTDGHTWVDQ